jgi:hypothetical protein
MSRSNREQIIQRLARLYREENDTDSVDPDGRFADYLIENGVKPPRVPTPRELLARVAKAALKHDIRRDEVTGQPYRGWHPVPVEEDPVTGQRHFLYFDIEVAKRIEMEKAVQLRVSGMVNDGVQVVRDAAHWNRINPDDAPLAVQEMLDLRDPVEWRMNSEEDLDDDEDGMGDEPAEPSSP